MFITKATRHDVADIQELLEPNGQEAPNPRDGVVFIARSGKVVGCLRLKEVAPHAVVIDKMTVAEDRRGEGIGKQLMQAAMNAKGGTLYLYCHEDAKEFYEGFGFTPVAPDALPEPVMDHFVHAGEYPAPEGHPSHHFFKAR
ncbi:MAG: GNAT family N-acetyltransferase [Actinomycetota bacterium]